MYDTSCSHVVQVSHISVSYKSFLRTKICAFLASSPAARVCLGASNRSWTVVADSPRRVLVASILSSRETSCSITSTAFITTLACEFRRTRRLLLHCCPLQQRRSWRCERLQAIQQSKKSLANAAFSDDDDDYLGLHNNKVKGGGKLRHCLDVSMHVCYIIM